VTATLVDSSVLLDIFEDDPRWGDWSQDALEKESRLEQLFINPVIYAEVSIAFQRIEELEDAIQVCGLKMTEIPREALFLSGKAFMAYKRMGGSRSTPLPDFFIGAHAAVASFKLLTRDPRRVRRYFPTVKLISPSA